MITRKHILGLVLFWALFGVQAHGQLTVTSSVTQQMGSYRYSYDVMNQSAEDVSIVTLGGLFQGAEAVENLTAPAGFLALYDSSLGLLSFIEDTQPFLAGALVAGFTFESPYAPSTGFFEAISINGTITFGNVAVPATPVPEPATMAAFGSLLLLGLIVRRIRTSRTQ